MYRVSTRHQHLVKEVKVCTQNRQPGVTMNRGTRLRYKPPPDDSALESALSCAAEPSGNWNGLEWMSVHHKPVACQPRSYVLMRRVGTSSGHKILH